MTAEEKKQFECLCEEFPRDAVTVLLSIMGPSELWDGIPIALEDDADFYDGWFI